MKTRLQKLMGASAGAGALCGTVVVALVGMLLAFPSTAHAQSTALPTPISGFEFENSIEPTYGTPAWYWDKDNPVYVDSLREGKRAVTIDTFHPGMANDTWNWTDSFSVMAYVNLAAAPDKGVIVSFGNNVFLRKLNATTVTFGTTEAAGMVQASLARLSEGYHLITVTKTTSEISIQIDGEAAVAEAKSITPGPGYQLGTRWQGANANAAVATGLLIDEVLVYDVALSSEQRAALVAAYPAMYPPEVPKTMSKVVSLNFASGGASVGDTVVQGLEAVPGSAWMNLTGQNGTNVALSKYWDGTQSATLENVTATWTSKNVHYWTNATDVILKRYLDDGNRVTVTFPKIPFDKYDLITYHATDTENYQFKAIKLTTANGTATYYTANDDDPTTAMVVTGDGETTKFGKTQELVAAYATSTTGNALRVRNLTSPSLSILTGTNDNSARGCLAAVQIVEVPVAIYEAAPEGDATYSELTWEVDGISQTTPPGAADVAEVTLAAGATLTMDTAIEVARLRLVCAGDCTLVVAAPTYLDAVGALELSGVTGQVTIASSLSKVQSWQEKVVYTAGAGAEGAPADVRLDGGTMQLVGEATYYLANNTGASEIESTVTITDATVDVDGIFGVGQATYTVSGTAEITADRFILSQGGVGRTSIFTLTNDASVTVNGTTDADADTASVMFGLWNGPTTYTQSENASFSALADVLIGKTGNNHIINIEGGMFTARGIKLSANATGTNTLNLSGGELLLGETGITSYGANNTLQINVTGTPTIKSSAAMTISQPIDLAAGAVLTLDATDGDITLTHVPTGSGKIAIVGGNLKFALTDATMSNAIFDATLAGIAPSATFNLVDGTSAAITATWNGDAATVTTTATTVTITAPTTLNANPTTTGNSWWWDYEFNGNTQSIGRFTTTLQTEGADFVPYSGTDEDTNRALYFHRTPYTQPAQSPIYPAELTAMMYCQPGNHANTVLIGFGSSTEGTQYAISLVTGDNPAAGEMKLILSQGMSAGGATILADLEVPNATTAYHLYAFSLKVIDGKTQISIYLDGHLITRYTHTEVIVLGSGFQVGSIHGGVGALDIEKYGDQEGYTENPDVDTGLLDFLRVADFALSDAAIARMSQEDAYPYVSPSGLATRVVDADDTTWEQANTWVQTIDGATTNPSAPKEGTNVAVTVNADASLELNLTADVTYESLKVTGAPLTLTKAADNALVMEVQGLTLETDLTVPYASMSIGTLTMAADTTLTVDISSLFEVNADRLTAVTIPLHTGAATRGDGATVVVTPTTDAIGRRATADFDADTMTWSVTIAPPVNGFMKHLTTADAKWSDIRWEANTMTSHGTDALVVYTDGDCELTIDEWVEAQELIFAGVADKTLTIHGSTYLMNVPSAKIEIDVSLGMETAEFFPQVTIDEGKSYTYDTTGLIESGATVTMNKVTGGGTLVKTGTGTLKLTPLSSADRVVIDGATIDVQQGALVTYLGNGADPLVRNATLTFAEGTEFKSHGRVDVDTLVTIENEGDLEFVAADGVTPAFKLMDGVAGALTKRGTGKLTLSFWNLFDAPITISAGTLAVKAQEPVTWTKAILGEGKLELVSGALTLSPTSNNTYTGGTHLMEGTTLTMTHAGALGTSGAITGSGTLVSSAGLPTNQSGLNADTWTGHLKVNTFTSNVDLSLYGNAASKVELAEGGTFRGYLNMNNHTYPFEFILNGTLTLDNGSKDKIHTFATLSGTTGTLNAAGTSILDTYRFQNAEAFTGTIAVSNNRCVVLGTGEVTRENNVLFITEGPTVRIPDGKTWSATRVQVNNGGTLGGTGTIDCALTFANGAELDATGATPLKVTGAVTSTGTMKVCIPVGEKPAFGTTGYKVIDGATGTTEAPEAEVYLVDGENIAIDSMLSVGMESDGLYVKNENTSAIKTWTNTTGDGKWSTLANWSQGGNPLTTLPGENDAVLIRTTTTTTLTMDVADTAVAAMAIEGSTLEIVGETLTVSDVVTVGTPLTLDSSVLATQKWNLLTGSTVNLTVADGTTVTYHSVEGDGRLTKLGAGTLQLQVASDSARTVADGVTIDVQAGTLQTWLYGSDANPMLKDTTLIFAEGTAFKSHGWVGLDGTVTVETNGALELAAADGYTPSIQGTGALIKTGTGTFTVTLFDANTYAHPMTVDGGTLAFKTNSATATPTLSGVISGEGNVAIHGATVKLTAANTFTGTTTIEQGGILDIADIDRLPGTSLIVVNETGTLKLTTTGTTKVDDLKDLSKITGTGTVWYSGSGWRTLPNTEERRFSETLAVRNDQAAGLILSQDGDATITMGSISGASTFRYDYESGGRTLRIVQAKHTEHTGNFLYGADPRLTKIQVAGATGATEKTLTLSGTTTVAKPLEIEDSGSVAIIGRWAGAVTVAGELGGSGTINGAVTFNEGGTLVVGSAPLTVAPTMTAVSTWTIRLTESVSVGEGCTLLTFSGTADLPMLDLSAITVVDATGATVPNEVEWNLPTRSLVLSAIPVTREVSGVEAWSKPEAWNVKGEWMTTPPTTSTVIVTTLSEDATLTSEVAPLAVAQLEAVGAPLTLSFTPTIDYQNVPRAGLVLPLITTSMGLTNVDAEVRGLQYGAVATLTQTETSISARITLPQSFYQGTLDYPTLPETVFQVTLSGEKEWNDLWTTDSPGANDLVMVTLDGDAVLSYTEGNRPAAVSVVVYGQGHTLALPHVDAMTGIASWRFDQETTYLFQMTEDALPENTELYPGRVRYDYFYEDTVGYTTTDRYVTEFAVGYNGPSPILNGGTLEFSGGQVTMPMIAPTATYTTLIFSGMVQAELVDASASEGGGTTGLRLGEVDLWLRDYAVVRTPKVVTADGAASRVTRMMLEDDAQLLVTGRNNTVSNAASLLFAHWDGTSELTLRDRAQLIAKDAVAVLAHSGASSYAIEDEAKMQVAGMRVQATGNAQTSSVVVQLNGGQLLLGKAGITAVSTRTITLNFAGGALGAWQDMIFGEEAAAVCTTVNGTPTFASDGKAVLTIADASVLGAATTWMLQSGVTQIDQPATTMVPQLTIARGATAQIASEVETPKVDLQGGTLAFTGGLLTLTEYAAIAGSVIEIPLVERFSESGYLKMAEDGATGLPATVPDFKETTLRLTLDANRATSSRVLPEVVLCLGATDGASATVKSILVQNNTGNAIASHEAILMTGILGEGLYVKLTGSEVMDPEPISLADYAQGYTLTQDSVNVKPYLSFIGPGAINVAEGGVALPYAAFTTDATTIVAQGTEPTVLMQGKGYTIATDLTFDLTAWKDALEVLARGAVKGVPVSICLMSGGIQQKADVTFTAKTDLSVSGVTEQIVTTLDGVYYVLTGEERLAQTVSVNFTTATVPLAAPPAKPGAYAVPVAGWNSLSGSFSSVHLMQTDLAGMPGLQAMRTIPAPTEENPDATTTIPTQLAAYTTTVGQNADAPFSMVKVWMDDTVAQRVTIANVPFAYYRIALVFASDVPGAAFAPVTVNGASYTMDAQYARRNVLGYRSPTVTTSATVDVLGDTQWGTTNRLNAATLMGENTLVTEVLTDATATIELPALRYGQTYAGLAALQILEAPAIETAEVSEATYTYTFTTADATKDLVKLAEVTTENGPWVSHAKHTLKLVFPTELADAAVTVELPTNFVAKAIVTEGVGSLTLQVANDGGARLEALNAATLKNVTAHFPMEDVNFTPATEISRFNGAFNNKGAPYTIVAGATLALGEDSGIVTNLDAGTPTLTIAAGSEGTLRRDYPVMYTDDISDTDVGLLTIAGQTMTFNRSGHVVVSPTLLIEEGDTIDASATGLWLNIPQRLAGEATSPVTKTYDIRQTGGNVEIATTGGDHGLLIGVNGNKVVDANYTLTKGFLTLSQLTSWEGDGHLTMNVSDQGYLTMIDSRSTSEKNFYTRASGGVVELNVTNGGTLELVAGNLQKAGSGTTTVTISDAHLVVRNTMTQLSFPIVFHGETEIKLEPFSTLVLNEANTGDGTLVLPQGTLLIANADALDDTMTVQVASAATIESGIAVTSGTLVITEGARINLRQEGEIEYPFERQLASAISVVQADGTTAGDWDQVTFCLNGKPVASDAVEVDGNVIRFTAAPEEVPTALTWKAVEASGTWQEGVADPWNEGAYYDGASVTFGANAASEVAVTVPARVTPSALSFEGASASYRFNGTGSIALAGESLALGAGHAFDVPMVTESAATDLLTTSATLRLVGVLSDGEKTASLVGSGNLNGDTVGNHGRWLRRAETPEDGTPILETLSMTFTPHAGETQILSSFETHMAGVGIVIAKGQKADDGTVSGGTVRFNGNVTGTNYNSLFAGTFRIQDGAILDFDITRTQGNDNNAYFRQFANDTTLLGKSIFTLTNGATLRFGQNCRAVIAGYDQRANEAVVTSQPMVIGKDSKVVFAYNRNDPQVLPHGITMNGDGATIEIGSSAAANWHGLYLTRGITLKVAGIGDVADASDPKAELTTVQTPQENIPVYQLKEGITAYITAVSEDDGLVRFDANTIGEGVTFEVGEGSTLRIQADLTLPNDASATLPFIKIGEGTLTFDRAEITTQVPIVVREGTLSGQTMFTHEDSEITVADGATIEAGLSTSWMRFDAGAIFAIDPTGEALIHAERMIFGNGKAYTVRPLTSTFLSFANREPIKVMGWGEAQGVSAAHFILDPALVNAGFGLTVAEDGLYLKTEVTYVRELTNTMTPPETGVTLLCNWYADGEWRRGLDLNGARGNYTPKSTESPIALFILPEAQYKEYKGPITVQLRVDRETTFSAIRFATYVDGNPKTLRPLAVTVVYQYVLTQSVMPAADEAASFTWVPSLLVDTPEVPTDPDKLPTAWSALPTTATLKPDVPDGYEVITRDTTVTVYRKASAPAINLNFTGKGESDTSWISTSSLPCGAVPFAGVYWNNVSPVKESTFLASLGTHAVYSYAATIAGVEDARTAGVTYIASTVKSLTTRRGQGNTALSSGYLAGSTAAIPENAYLTAPNTEACGWLVKVDNIPFAMYDLYLLFAGEDDDAMTYPAVQIKVGDNAWRSYSIHNGWVAPTDTASTWEGVGGLVRGGYLTGGNMLHLRLAAPNTGASIQIAACDAALGADAPTVGLAALQIVEATDGVAYERLSSGNWSANKGWKLVETIGPWQDATPDTPRAAVIDGIASLNVDTSAATPWIRLAGNTSLRLTGLEGALNLGAVDCTDLGAVTVDIVDDIFAQAPNIVFAPNMTLTVPESQPTTTNAWNWIYPTTESQTSAILRKYSTNDLVIQKPIYNSLQIDKGTLWLHADSGGSYTRAGAITSTTADGVLGKQGPGTITLTGSLQLNSETPIRVTEGTLTVNTTNGFSGLPSGSTVEVDHGTLSLGYKSYAAGMTIHAMNGARFETPGSFTGANTPLIILENGGTLYRAGGDGGNYDVYCYQRVTARGKDNILSINAGGYGSGATIMDKLFVASNATLTLVGSAGGLRLPETQTIDVQTGGLFISRRPIGVGTGGYYATPVADKPLIKIGGGIWRVEDKFTSKSDDNRGEALDIREGEVHFARGGAEHECTTANLPITVQEGAKIAGNVVFTANTPLVIKTGGILRSGLSGDANSKIKAQSITFEGGAVLEVDLDNAAGLEVPADGTVAFGAKLNVTLTKLPTSITRKYKLTNFSVLPSGSPTISCPAAVALDAEVRFGDTTVDPEEDSKNLYLVPSAKSYTWTEETGSWSEAKWTYGDTTDQKYPVDTSALSTVARLAGTAATTQLTMDRKTGETETYTTWDADSIIFATERNTTFTLLQGADATATDTLNRAQVRNTLWKLGPGAARVETPILFFNASTLLNVTEGALTVVHPFLDSFATEQRATVTVDGGATLTFALTASDALKQAAAAETIKYDPMKQTLAGDRHGSGTIVVDSPGSELILSGQQITVGGVKETTDNDLNYHVKQGTLTLEGDIPRAMRSTARKMTVETGAVVKLSGTALGWSSDWVLALAAGDDESGVNATTRGARIETLDAARLRGEIAVTSDATGGGHVILGSTEGALDGDVLLNLPGTTTLKMAGLWQTPEDTASGQITKDGTGTWVIANEFASNLPVELKRGRTEIQMNGGIMVRNHATTLNADWVVRKGATLRFNEGSAANQAFGATGSLTIDAGAILDMTSSNTTFTAGTSSDESEDVGFTFEDGAYLHFGNGMTLENASVTFSSRTRVKGSVFVVLNVPVAALDKRKSYRLVTFTDGTASRLNNAGLFQLAGDNLVDLALEGWTLRDEGGTVTLEAFASGSAYTWAKTTDGNWATGAAWQVPDDLNAALKTWTEVLAQEEANETFPAVVFADHYMDGTTEVAIPTEARTVNWTDTTKVQTLLGLQCNNDAGDYTLQAKVNGRDVAAKLNINGDFLKIGASDLVVTRPLTLRDEGTFKILGGNVRLQKEFTAKATALTIGGAGSRLTIENNMDMTLAGIIEGDGQGTIAQAGEATLTLASPLEKLAALDVQKGIVALTAPEQLTLVPKVNLATDAVLSYEAQLVRGGNVAMSINSETAFQGILSWAAHTPTADGSTVRLVAPTGVTDAYNIAALHYAPKQGHLVLNPGLLPSTAKLHFVTGNSETSALWVGADTTHGSAFTLGGLSGTGILGVEPVTRISSGTWSTARALTLDLDEDVTFAGTFMGRSFQDGSAITLGLTVNKRATASVNPRFTYTGTATNPQLGMLTVGSDARVDINGRWASAITVQNGGTLGGNGILGKAADETEASVVTVSEGAILTASTTVVNSSTGNAEETPTTLTVPGLLQLDKGTILRVLGRRDSKDVATVSCVDADMLVLPEAAGDANGEVNLSIVLEVEVDENGQAKTVFNNVPILRWKGTDGLSNLNATVKVVGTNGADLTASEDYYVVQQTDVNGSALVLMRRGARFWMILH